MLPLIWHPKLQQHLLPLVWHPKLQQHQIQLNSYRKLGNTPNGPKKAQAFQAKKAESHKHNYDKCSRATALEVGDMVLVHATTFKGHHKIQDRWEKREYVVENWPFPNVPVYVVCPRDGDGHSWTLHRNCLLPINSNIGQGERDTPMAGVESNNTSTPVPPVDSVPADAGPSGMDTSSAAGNTPQGSPDHPAPLRCSVWKTQNWLPWRYWNFGLQTDTNPSGIWDAWIGLSVCLHIVFCLYTIFWENAVWITLYLHHHVSTKHYSVLALRGILSMCSLQWIFEWWGNGPKDIWPMCSCPTVK